LQSVKKLFNKFLVKLNLHKHIMNVILRNLFNKYIILINILFLFFFKDTSSVKKSLALYVHILADKLSLNDSSLCN